MRSIKLISLTATAVLLLSVAGCTASDTDPSRKGSDNEEHAEGASEGQEFGVIGSSTGIDYDIRTEVSRLIDFNEDLNAYRIDYSVDTLVTEDPGYPKLQEFLKKRNSENLEYHKNIQKELIDKYKVSTDGKNPLYGTTLRISVSRSDSSVFSFIEEASSIDRGLEFVPVSRYSQEGKRFTNIDPATGEEIRFEDVFETDRNGLDRIICEELYKTEDISDDKIKQIADIGYTFLITERGVTILFNEPLMLPNATIDTDTCLIDYKDHGDILNAGYFGLPNEVMLSFEMIEKDSGDYEYLLKTSDREIRIKQGESDDSLNQLSPSDGDMYVTQRNPNDHVIFEYGGGSVRVDVEPYFLIDDVRYTTVGGQDHVYICFEHQEPHTVDLYLTDFRLDDGKITNVGKTDIYFPLTESTNSKCFEVYERTDFPGADMTRIMMKLGDDGIPVPTSDVYTFTDTVPLDLKLEMTGKIVKDRVVTDEEKTTEKYYPLTPYESDMRSYIDYVDNDGNIIRFELSFNDGQICINGTPAGDIFIEKQSIDWSLIPTIG